MTSFPIGAMSVPAIPKTRAQPQTLPLITTSTALLVLLNPMEYEATTMYLLRMLVRDTTSGLVGNLTVQVNNVFVRHECLKDISEMSDYEIDIQNWAV